MTHMHITSWLLGFILFAIVLILMKQGKEKPAKITQMILRLDYLFILYTGGDLLALYLGSNMGILGEVIVKSLAGVWLIAAMEMVLAKTKKNEPAKGGWIQFVIALLLVLILGFVRLEMGIHL
ncbi:UPF0344 protein YisL [Compostibacillus humi]|uniref:UPF0344 protein GCM10010978_10650 n=1 Tax=Compostibacillus humi TaxID=1245525 RepID=A0A8J2ZQF4_9BACI|nr:YisL family protein [Compostibacillus humi]GGH73110.1 UPF0344 protein YisL [Compostibacillus humi]HLT56188.1 YisL family protein [Bacillota bacterium]